MLFKFKSQAAADLIMMEADARRLLKIMLGDDPQRGIIEVAHLPAAIARLESAVAQDEAARRQRDERAAASAPVPAHASVDSAEALDPVHLSQRAAPMVKLLKRCQAEVSDVVWGI